MRVRYALLAAALVLGVLPAAAQRNVPPSNFLDPATFLNRVIDSDGGPAGPRTETEYVLQPGGTYYVDGEIANTGWNLTVRASSLSADPLAKPRIVPLAGDGGATLGTVFASNGNLTLRGVYVTGQDDLGAFLQRIVRVQADNVTVRVEDSWMDYSAQSAIRVDNAGGRVLMYRSIVSNQGRMNSIDNGRAVDMRGTLVAEIDWVDNVFYNITSRAYRSGGGTAERIRMRHNTFANVGQRSVEVGRVRNLVFEDNLVVNPAFTGVRPPFVDGTQPALEFLDIAGATVAVRNTNTFYNPEVVSTLQNHPNGPYVPRPTYFNGAGIYAALGTYIAAAGTGPTLTELPVAFQGGVPVQRVVDAINAERDTDGNTFSDLETRTDGLVAPVARDFRYATSNPLYTASTQGQPLGALFIYGVAVSSDGGPDAAGALALRAFPNPAASVTRVAFALDAPADVRLAVYDVLGREVAAVAERAFAAGAHALDVDVRALPAGAYVARLVAGERAEAVRLTVAR